MLDWGLVKTMTLWNYEELTNKILGTFSYSFIKKHYNHNMKEGTSYLVNLLGYDAKNDKYINRMVNIFTILEDLKIVDYEDLIYRVGNKGKCENFIRTTKISFEDLILVLNYIFRWVLPRQIYLMEVIDTESECHRVYVEKLKHSGIRFNLDLLENGKNRSGREKLSENTVIPEPVILEFVNRADMSRMPFSNRKTVKHLLACGYNSINQIAETDSVRFVEDMRLYFKSIDVRLSGFIDLAGISRWARTIPTVVEY
jgi:hypothetical protein